MSTRLSTNSSATRTRTRIQKSVGGFDWRKNEAKLVMGRFGPFGVSERVDEQRVVGLHGADLAQRPGLQFRAGGDRAVLHRAALDRDGDGALSRFRRGDR